MQLPSFDTMELHIATCIGDLEGGYAAARYITKSKAEESLLQRSNKKWLLSSRISINY